MHAPDLAPAPAKSHFQWLLKLGMWRGVGLITGFSTLASMLLTGSMLLVLGVRGGPFWTAMMMSVIVPLLVASLVGTVVLRMMQQLDAARRLVQELAVTDGLTGVCNRRHFMELADAECLRATRYGLALSLLMIDADHFKRVNDEHGHPTGDEVLCSLARACGQAIRAADTLARYGGEEFVVLLPMTDRAAAAQVAERVRSSVAALQVPTPSGQSLSFTVSIGVATRSSRAATLAALLNRADQAMYRAKQEGRNRVDHDPVSS